VVYLYLTGFWQAGGGANGRRVTGSGRVGAQQVVEGGRYISAAIIIVTPGNYPKENILHTEHGESLKSRNVKLLLSTP